MIALTTTECAIVELLLRRSPAVISRRTIAVQVWDEGADAVDSNTIDVHVARLRAKLEGSRARHRDRPRQRISVGGIVKANWAHRSHAAKVAAVATMIVMVLRRRRGHLNLFVVHRLTTEVDARLALRLVDASRLTLQVPSTGVRRGMPPTTCRREPDPGLFDSSRGR